MNEGRGLKARVRGIYSTALTRLLLDHGFEIVQPSVEIYERLGLKPSEEASDLSIRDRFDRQGVEASGVVEAVEAFSSILRKDLMDVILRRKLQDRGFLDAEFPSSSKTRLDEYRDKVTSTAQGHHLYKATGGSISSAADMAERLLLMGQPAAEVEKLLKRTIEPYYPIEGSEIGIEHVKLSGAIYNLGRAVIEEYIEGSSLRCTRILRSEGVYDGLGTRKEAGDRAITEAKLGEYYTETRYFSNNSLFKGTYVNLATPVELYPSKLRYVDLEVDICLLPSGEVRILDEELLERAAEEDIIADKLLKTVKAKTKEILASLKTFSF